MRKELFIISLMVFITVLIWITVEIYHTNSTKKFGTELEKELNIVIKPIDTKKVEKLLKER